MIGKNNVSKVQRKHRDCCSWTPEITRHRLGAKRLTPGEDGVAVRFFDLSKIESAAGRFLFAIPGFDSVCQVRFDFAGVSQGHGLSCEVLLLFPPNRCRRIR